MIHKSYTPVYLKVPEGYIGFVEELPGANSQGATLEEVRRNLREAVTLIRLTVRDRRTHEPTDD